MLLQEDDAVGCVERLGRAIELVTTHPGEHKVTADTGRRTASQFNRENFATYLETFWRSMLGTESNREASVAFDAAEDQAAVASNSAALAGEA